MLYTQAIIQKIADAVRNAFPGRDLSFVEESVYLLDGTCPHQLYFIDNASLAAPQTDVLLFILEKLSEKDNRERARQLCLLPGQDQILRQSADKDDNARRALEALKQLHTRRPALLGSVQTEINASHAQIIRAIIEANHGNSGQGFTVVTKNRELGEFVNTSCYFEDEPVLALYPTDKGVVRRNTSLPALPVIETAGPVIPLDQSDLAPCGALVADGETIDTSQTKDFGNEGAVYFSRDGSKAFKIFHHVFLPGSGGARKLQALCQLGQKSTSPDLCLPKQLIYDCKANVAGYPMDRAQGQRLSDILSDTSHLRDWFPDRLTAVELALDVTIGALRLVYNRVLPLDLSANNIMVHKEADGRLKPSLIDLDSCQIRNYPSACCTPNITPPWLKEEGPYANYLRSLPEVGYAVYSVVFQLLVNGLAPCGDDGSQFVFDEKLVAQRDIDSTAALDPYFYVFSSLPYSLKVSFRETFTEPDPAKQPDLLQLFSLLLNTTSYLRSGSDQLNMLWPSTPKPSELLARCARCGRQLPVNFLRRYRKSELLLCKSCLSIPVSTRCSGCGEDMDLSLQHLLVAEQKGTFPLYCRACASTKKVLEPDAPLNRPFTQADRALIDRLLRQRRSKHAPPPPAPAPQQSETKTRLSTKHADRKPPASASFLDRFWRFLGL